MRNYWWVNHKQTFRQEIDGQYLWSPKTNRDGARNEFYNNMRRANPGDWVLSYADQAISYLGRVADFAFTAPKPSEFGDTGSYWNKEGWLLPVFWTELQPPVYPRTFIDLLRPILPIRYSPISLKTGHGNQGAYLAAIPQNVFEAVVVNSGFDHDRLENGGTNSLNYEAVTETLEDKLEQQLAKHTEIGDTERTIVIQARRGQGKFRKSVEAIEPKCRLTSVTNPTLLIAGHIKPWRACETNQERIDGMNGLMLTPDADLLFDRGFISFKDDGEVMISPRVDRRDLKRLGFDKLAMEQFGFAEAPSPWQVGSFRPEQCEYMAFHRSDVFVE